MTGKQYNFGVMGVGGYIAPRHLRAIRDTGNNISAVTDPHDSVGLLDAYGFNIAYFREIERFDRHLAKLRKAGESKRIHYISVCTPNYLHDSHIRMALRNDSDVICEKPLVINPWNLDLMEEVERETSKRVYTVLQLRLHPSLVKLKNSLPEKPSKKAEILLTYITSRGVWYDYSWKGRKDCSGGIAINIGIHFFDMLLWMFGRVINHEVHLSREREMAGFLELERANVRWYLSIDHQKLPEENRLKNINTYRSIKINGDEIEFSGNFTDLHNELYRQTLSGYGFGISDARPSIELVNRLNNSPIVENHDNFHPLLVG